MSTSICSTYLPNRLHESLSEVSRQSSEYVMPQHLYGASSEQRNNPKFYGNNSEVVIGTVRFGLKEKVFSVNKSEASKKTKEQSRYDKVVESFSLHRNGLNTDKMGFVYALAKEVCKIDFVDVISEFNDLEDTIDTVLTLARGVKLSISQFIDEGTDAPVVFSIFMDQELLVTDELALNKLVNKLNSVI